MWDWLRHGWHIVIGYVMGFFVMLLLLGWNPQARERPQRISAASAQDVAGAKTSLHMNIPPATGGLSARPTPCGPSFRFNRYGPQRVIVTARRSDL